MNLDDIKMNFDKMKTIVEWEKLTHLKEIQTFLKFVNFYKRFIKNFFKVVKFLVKLIKKDQTFSSSKDCQTTFDELKKRMIETSILSYFSSELKTFLKSDSLNYISVKILLQKENDDLIKSITYFSKTLSSVECNYEIYDKELLTIICCFEQWRAELQSVDSFRNVLIDHKILKYFMTIKKLNKRQIKWAEFLAEFDFQIAYQSKKKNDKADSLTRQLENRSINDRNKHMHRTMLSTKKVDSRIVQKLNDTKKNLNSKLSFFDKIKSANQKNVICTDIRNAIRNQKKSFDEMLLKKFESIENILFFKKKLWISEFDQLKLNIIKKIHDQLVSEHSSIRRICKYLSKWYYWSQVKEMMQRYVANCHICKRFKTSRDKYSELLNSLSISNRLWINMIMNFVIQLSKIKNGFNAILMIINRLTITHHYVSCIIEKCWKIERWSGAVISWDDEMSWWDSEPRTIREISLFEKD
jgi:hypothetical protein